MPRYTVQAPDGRTVTVEGDEPPTDADLDGIFAGLPAEKPDMLAMAAAKLKEQAAGPLGLVPPFSLLPGSSSMQGGKKALLTGARSLGRLANPLIRAAGGLPVPDQPFVSNTGKDLEAPAGVSESLTKAGLLASPAMVGGGLPAMAAGGAVSGVVSGEQDPLKVAASGLLNAGIGAAGKAAGALARSVGESGFIRAAINKIINLPKSQMVSELGQGRNPADILLKEGVPPEATKSVTALAKWASGRVDEVGAEIGQAIDSLPAGTQVDLGRIVNNATNDAIRRIKSGPTTFGTKSGKVIVEQLRGIRQGLMRSFQFGPQGLRLGQVSPREAFDVKKIVGEEINWGKLPKDQQVVEKAKIAIYENISKSLGRLSPELGNLNRRFTSLVRTSKALEGEAALAAKRALPLSLKELLQTAGAVRAQLGLATAKPALDTTALRGLGAMRPSIPGEEEE